ncbi:MAG TPA: DUF885 family protein, partial [Labilithrix sp.]
DVEAEGPGLDRDAALRAGRYAVRYLEQDAHATNLELALLPNAALQHSLLHARTASHWEALVTRARAVPGFLAKHEENLRRGVREGRAADRDVATAFAERVIGGAAASTRGLAANAAARGVEGPILTRIDDAARAASDAYRAFGAFVRDHVVPKARAHVRLGEEEVRFRLRDVMGVDREPAALVALAKEELAAAQAAMEKHARDAGHASARAAAPAICAHHPPSYEDAVALYERELVEIVRFIRPIVPIPEPLALAFDRLPPGVADGASVTNWPAPLLDPEGRGHALCGDDLSAHVTIAAKQLAIHEAIPGHYLQSVAWQRAMESGALKRESIVRFLGVFDDVAMSRAYYGTMLAVEGWAVYMERLMREQGFYKTPEELFFAAMCDAIRAVRVVIDIEMHAGDASPEALHRFVADSSLFGDRYATYQTLRIKRMPLQGLTYLVGALEIEALRDAANAKGTELLELHRQLLAVGPVPPSRYDL